MTGWDPEFDRRRVECVQIGGSEVRAGDRVRLNPRGRADILDLALQGKLATVEALEQDFEGRVYLAVTVDDDPGRDLGELRQPGHRFFFLPDDVEPVPPPRVLVAGVGNIFLGDDAFGVEVARRLATRPLPAEVRVVDFGIRGLDLSFALIDGYEAVILVDAAPRGGQPGTLYLLEPDPGGEESSVEPHTLNPARVIRLAATMGCRVKRLILVGCEPGPPGDVEELAAGLSAPVRAAVDEAVPLVESLVEKLLSEGRGQTTNQVEAQESGRS